MSRRKCCCGRDCWVVSDDFDRANSDDPGPYWDEVGEDTDWDLVDNEIHCIVEGPLVTTHRQPAPTRSGAAGYNLRVSVDLIDFPESGTKQWGIIVGYIDENNFDWVSLDYNASTNYMYPTFYHRTGGTDSVVMNPADYPGNDPFGVAPGEKRFRVFLCYAGIDWSVYHLDYQWTVGEGGRIALPDEPHGLVGFLMGDFDTWNYLEHWESNPECTRCSCICRNPNDENDYAYPPETLHLTLVPSGDAYACSGVDFATFTLYQTKATATSNPPTLKNSAWKYQWVSYPFRWGYEWMWWVLRCTGSGESDNFVLLLGNYNTTDPYHPANNLFFDQTPDPWQPVDWTQSTCEPINLVFPNLHPYISTCPWPNEDDVRPYICMSGECWEDGAELSVRWDAVVTV